MERDTLLSQIKCSIKTREVFGPSIWLSSPPPHTIQEFLSPSNLIDCSLSLLFWSFPKRLTPGCLVSDSPGVNTSSHSRPSVPSVGFYISGSGLLTSSRRKDTLVGIVTKVRLSNWMLNESRQSIIVWAHYSHTVGERRTVPYVAPKGKSERERTPNPRKTRRWSYLLGHWSKKIERKRLIHRTVFKDEWSEVPLP